MNDGMTVGRKRRRTGNQRLLTGNGNQRLPKGNRTEIGRTEENGNQRLPVGKRTRKSVCPECPVHLYNKADFA